MDSSPRPPRRFSRWQTTRRPFVLTGVVCKPQNTIQNLQDGRNKSEIAKEKIKKVNESVNGKVQKNSLDHSTADSMKKQIQHSLSSGKRPPVVRRLCLDTNKRKERENVAAITAEVVHSVQVTSHNGSDNFAFENGKLHQNIIAISADKSDNCLTTDKPLSQELPTQHARGDAGIINDETNHQNNKCALSNISQNTSADKSAAIQTLLSQTKADITQSNASQSAKEASVLIRETNKRKISAFDDEESSSTSSTDKENKDKDPANSDVPLVIKKLKQDGALHSLSTSAANNVAIENVNVAQSDTILNNQNLEGEVLGARMSTLRNRNLLASPKTLLWKRQYPVFNSSEKSEFGDASLSRKNKSSLTPESSFKKKASKRQLPFLEMNLKQQSIIKPPPKKPSTYKIKRKSIDDNSLELKKQNKSVRSTESFKKKQSPVLEMNSKQQSIIKSSSKTTLTNKIKKPSVDNRSLELKKQNKSHKSKTLNISEVATESSNATKEKQANCTDPHEASSSSVSGRLRNRRSLPTPEEVQQKRQYPISFYLSSRKSPDHVKSNSKHGITAKKKQNSEVISSLDQTESSVFKNLTSNKERTLDESSNNRNYSAPKHLSLNSPVSKKPSQLARKSGKLHHGITETTAEAIDGGNTSIRLQTGSSVKYPGKKHIKQSSYKHLKLNCDPELEIPSFTTQSALTVSTQEISVESNNDNSQQSGQISSKVINTEKSQNKSRKKNAQTSILFNKSPLEAKSRQFSLKRQAVKKSSDDEHSFSPSAERSSETVDISVQLSQLPATIADTSWKQSQRLTHERSLPQWQPNSEVNKVQTVDSNLDTVKKSKVSVSMDVVELSQKQSKKGKLEASTSGTQKLPSVASLSMHRRDSVPNKPQKSEKVSSQVKNTKQPTKKPQVETRVKDTTKFLSSNKSSHLKVKRKRYSLPRRPLKVTSNEERSISPSFEGNNSSFATVNTSVHLTQIPAATIVDTSLQPLQTAICKRHSSPLKSLKKKVQPVDTKQATITRPELSLNETVRMSQKQPKKRNILEEIARTKESTGQSGDNEVFLWCEDGSTGRGMDVTAYDVILQAMVDNEEELLDETESDSIENRTVRKVMSRLRRSIKAMITKVRETKNLRHDIRQQDIRIRKLMALIKEKQNIAQADREKNSRLDGDQDSQMTRYKEIMQGYCQLIQHFSSKS